MPITTTHCTCCIFRVQAFNEIAFIEWLVRGTKVLFVGDSDGVPFWPPKLSGDEARGVIQVWLVHILWVALSSNAIDRKQTAPRRLYGPLNEEDFYPYQNSDCLVVREILLSPNNFIQATGENTSEAYYQYKKQSIYYINTGLLFRSDTQISNRSTEDNMQTMRGWRGNIQSLIQSKTPSTSASDACGMTIYLT